MAFVYLGLLYAVVVPLFFFVLRGQLKSPWKVVDVFFLDGWFRCA